MTDKQRQVVSIIETNLGITFKGSSSQEARAFISKHMEASRQATVRHKTATEGLIRDTFGSYQVDRAGNIFEDDEYDYQAYTDSWFSSM